jgi:uncharacterized lipoprotein YmbA
MKTTPVKVVLAAASCMAILVSCAGPPLTLYTLNESESPNPPTLDRSARVIEISRASLPDELDNEDILVLDGSSLRKSSHGRWASRLSLQVTDLITQRLAARYPEALVTDRRQTEPPSMRITISITRLEVTSGGAASVVADWVMIPQDPSTPSLRFRREFGAAGSVATDHDVVMLEPEVLNRLAASMASDPLL